MMAGAMKWLAGIRLAGDRRGAISMEVGFLALPLVMLLLGAFELGLTLKTRAALQYAAEFGARCAVVTPTSCSSSVQVQAYVAPLLNGVTLKSNTFTLASASCGKEVTASLPYGGTLKIVLQTPLVLRARSCFPT